MDIYPNYIFQDVTKIDPKILKGKKLLIFDIDNTLFYSETTRSRKDIIRWFKKTHKKYPCVCYSNSFSIHKRKSILEKTLACEVYLSKYKKPSKELFQEISRRYKVAAQDIAVIGDFHFTDVLFANRNHATSILVRPIGNERKLILTFARVLENFVLFVLGFFA
ncbi:MAG: HAD-IIIA family hydrolase [bacterium]|nr:HAD-IIIA family hydrolase [bacterium]